MAKYQGHRSWNSWNVSLWLGNDENTYKYCQELVGKHGINKAARIFNGEMKGSRTPDGANYNLTCIREAFSGYFGKGA